MALVGVQKKIHVVDVTAAAGATAGKDNAKAPATDGTTDESEDSSRILKLPNKLKQLELHVPTDEKDVYAYYYIIKVRFLTSHS